MNVGDYRSDYAAYCSAVELAHYQHRVGFERELDLEAIYDRYGELFTLEAIKSLEVILKETSDHNETERRGLQMLAGAARIGYLETQARPLTNELARCEVAQLVEWNGETVPLHNVTTLMSIEPSASRRRELFARWIDKLSVCDDLRSSRLKSFHSSARDLGFDSYRTLFASVTGVDHERLAHNRDELLEHTESAYTSALSEATTRDLPDVSFEGLRHADYLFFQRLTRLDRFFLPEALMATYNASMRDLGINVDRQENIKIDDAGLSFTTQRASCFRIRPPDDVRLLRARTSGCLDYTDFFHEAGRAQHAGWSSRELISRHPEFLYSPDNSTAKAYAVLFSQLFLDDGWLVERRIAADRPHALEIVRDLALVACSRLRRSCGSLSYELALHDSAEERSQQLAATYATCFSQAVGFRGEAALYLTDVEDGFYSAACLRAWAFEASLSEYLRTRYGRRWWASRKSGDVLIDIWNTASRYTVEELAQLLGLGEISFELLADNLVAAMTKD